jgi:hypothetical protein
MTEIKTTDTEPKESPTDKCRKNELWYKLKQSNEFSENPEGV